MQGPGVLPYAYGAKGMGEICLIPTAPAAAWAYYKRDGKRRYSLPLRGTAYKKEEPNTFGGPQPTYGAPAYASPGQPTEAASKPVSYTHLDVYKRQALLPHTHKKANIEM